MRMKNLLGQRRNDHDLLCCFCVFLVPAGVIVPIAITILNGHAVCNDHLHLARDNKFMSIIEFERSRGI